MGKFAQRRQVCNTICVSSYCVVGRGRGEAKLLEGFHGCLAWSEPDAGVAAGERLRLGNCCPVPCGHKSTVKCYLRLLHIQHSYRGYIVNNPPPPPPPQASLTSSLCLLLFGIKLCPLQALTSSSSLLAFLACQLFLHQLSSSLLSLLFSFCSRRGMGWGRDLGVAPLAF